VAVLVAVTSRHRQKQIDEEVGPTP